MSMIMVVKPTIRSVYNDKVSMTSLHGDFIEGYLQRTRNEVGGLQSHEAICIGESKL